MSADILSNLRRVEIFANLPDDALLSIADLCRVERLPANHVVFREGDEGDEMYIIHQGSVKVMINTRSTDGQISTGTINVLYSGQCFGEMVLLGGATRSATVVTIDPATLLVMREPDFAVLCDQSPRIGFLVIRNLASDLAYKLRSSNLLLGGRIRWQRGELDPNATGD